LQGFLSCRAAGEILGQFTRLNLFHDLARSDLEIEAGFAQQVAAAWRS